MKIHKITLLNINSLKGKHCVDFDAGLSDAGLFAITGPTGAGKSSILDAICVALYGKTPRLSKGEDTSELMTRHTGECYAEIEFSAKDKQYRAHWSRKRAHNKSTGRVQPAKMELTLLGKNEKILESRINTVIQEVEVITGLDYDRFTRSILLAQGSFDAFLKADKNIKAELLEKLTGTDIYARISELVYNKEKSKSKDLEDLKSKLEGIHLWSQDERNIKQQEKSEKEIVIKKIVEDKDLVAKNILWLKNVDSLKKSLEEKNKDLKVVCDTIQAKKSDLEKLALAEKANKYRGDYESLKKNIEDKQLLTNTIGELGLKIEKLSKELIDAQANLDTQNDEFKKFKIEFKPKKRTIEKVRALDDKVVEAGTRYSEEKKKFDLQAGELDNAEHKVISHKNLVENAERKIGKLKNELERNSIDKELEGDYKVIEDKLKVHQVRRRECLATTDLYKENKEQGRINAEILAKTEESKKLIAKSISQKKSSLEVFQNNHKTILAGNTLASYEKKLKELAFEKMVIDELYKCGKEKAELQLSLKNKKNEVDSLEKKTKTVSSSIKKLKDKLEQSEQVHNELHKKKEQDLLISKYKEDRKRLKDNTSCPLCGSLEHPWAKGDLKNVSKDIDNILSKQSKEIQSLRDKISANQTEYDIESANLKNLLNDITKIEARINEEEKKWNNSIKKNKRQDKIEEWEGLSENLKFTEEKSDNLDSKLSEIKQLKGNIDTVKDELSEDNSKENEIGLKFTKEAEQKKQLDAEIKRLEADLKKYNKAFESNSVELITLLDPYDEKIPDEGLENVLLKKLKRRMDTFKNQNELLQNSKEELKKFQEILIGFDTDAKAKKDSLDKERKDLDELENALNKIKKERKEIFGEANPEEVEKLLETQNIQFEERIASGTGKVNDFKTDLANENVRKTEIDKQVKNLNEEYKKLEKEFAAKLEQGEFRGVKHFEESLMGDDDVNRLKNLKEDLETKRKAAEADVNSYKQQVNREEAKNLTNDKLETLINVSEAKKQEEEDARNAMSTLNAEFESQKNFKNQLKDVKSNIDIQEIETRKWKLLSSLIGSADGKKFRNFAQGLTLEQLIYFANQHLAKLYDRYYLQRKTNSEDLEIDIVDTYQANEIRPSINLSGGESFLVSLALALGLSKLVTRDVSIDSLFLDEGFGTLDPETLTEVISALSSLHQSGKTIGIISHVQELKEKITAQIEITKLSNGSSTLKVLV